MSTSSVIAQKTKDLGTIGEGGALGPFGGVPWGKTGETAAGKLAGALSSIVGLMTIVAGLFFLFQLVIGAIQWIASGSDKAGLEQARGKITNSLIGLILVVAAVAIVSLVGDFLGFKILDPASFIKDIRFK